MIKYNPRRTHVIEFVLDLLVIGILSAAVTWFMFIFLEPKNLVVDSHDGNCEKMLYNFETCKCYQRLIKEQK